jgi:hypothetical protein
VRIIYQHAVPWPEEGPLQVDARFRGEIPISPALARQRASGYLAREAALFVTAGEPLLILDEQPRWKVPTILRLRGYGNLAEVGPYSWPNLSWPGWEKITCAP